MNDEHEQRRSVPRGRGRGVAVTLAIASWSAWRPPIGVRVKETVASRAAMDAARPAGATGRRARPQRSSGA